jgi:quercetin dioxygenase-like cupin family protein
VPKIETLKKDALPAGPSSPGITRHIAFQGEGFRVLRSRGAPGTISGWHHHQDYEIYGYVASGSVRFETGPEGKDVVLLEAGDFFHVPARTVHREINPSADAEQEFVLFLQGTGPMVANVSGPGEV